MQTNSYSGAFWRLLHVEGELDLLFSELGLGDICL